MSEYEKTTTPNMVIDRTTGAVINTDMGAYEVVKKLREEKLQSNMLYDRVSRLETELHELRAMIASLSRNNEDHRD